MKTVKQVCKITGLSARALHHYDKIGLFKPAALTQAGYRLYDDSSLKQLQSILLYRELGFPLNDIKEIIASPNYERTAALNDQIRLLQLKKEHLEDLIAFAKSILTQGEENMDFCAFDETKLNRYAEEAKNKWGETDAYRECEQKTKKQSKGEMMMNASLLMDLFSEFGKIKHLAPESPEAQQLAANLQQFITKNYYNCTKQILSGLGQMYCAPGEMKDNIDRSAGEGTADFASKAIEIYCREE